MRVVFAGTPEVAVPALDAIAASRHELVGVVTRPDAPAGRGRKLVASPVAAARRGARRTGPQARAPARPRLPGGAARRSRPTAARWSRTARCCRSPRSTSRRTAGSTCTSPCSRPGAARRRCSTRSGPATRSPARPRSGSSRSSTPGPSFGVMTERIRPTDTAGDLLGRLAEGGAGTAGRDPRRHRRRLAGGPAAAGRGRHASPRRSWSRTPEVDWTEPAVAVDRQDPRLHARPRRLDDVRGRADQARPGHAHRRPRAGARRARGRQERRSSSAPAPTPCGSARSRRTASKQMPAADWARGVRLETGAEFGDG